MGDIFDDYINGVKKKKQERLGISEGTDIFDKYIQDVQTKSAERKSKQTAERNEAIYMSNMSPTEQGAYKRAKESNGAYSSPYLKEGREGKSDLVYGYDKWNRLTKANKEKWFDYVEQNKSKSDEPWEAKYAREILAGNSTRSKTAAQKNSEFLNKISAGLLPVWENKDGIPDELFDIESEKKWMWNSLPEDVKNGLRNAPGAWSQTVAKLTGKGEDADYVNRYNNYRKAEEYLKQYYNDDEIEMLKKYAEMVEDLEDVQTIKEIQSDLMASNPVYASVIAPIQQIGADIGASALSAPRTLWDLATERGNYAVVNPYKGNLQKAAEAGRGVQQEILEGLEGNTFMQNYYSASVSTAESAMRLALARGVASGLTSTTAFSSLPYDQVAGITMNALMFPSVVEQTATEMVQKGMPANQAIAKAVSAGIFECLFETVSFDKLGFFQEKPIVGNIKTFAANLLKSGFVEGSEEVATDIANELYDYFAAYDYSDFKAYKDKLEAQTGEKVTDLEAWDGYKKEFADKLLKSFVGGAVSGLTMGAASNAQGIANARALNAKGETVSDADAERMRSVVDNVAAYNPNVRELMENTMGNETTVRGAMADVIEQMEKTYIKSIEKATTEKQLNTVMENLNTNLNGLISENAFNAYNAKMIELGKEGADYQTFLTNRDKGNQTTFSDLAYGTGDNYISRQYTEAKNEMENAMRNTTNGMNMEERIASVERAAELMSKSQELAEDIVAKYGEQGKTLDSPELRKYVGILGEESAARALTLGKLARESNTENVNLKGGKVYELKDTAEIERMLGKGASAHLKSAEYNEVKNNPLFRVVSVMTGANVAFYASDQHLSIKNGAYDPKTNTFYFDANAGTSGTHAALGEVISHELTHWIRANNEAGYDRLYMFIRNDMGADAFDSLVKEHMDRLGLDTNVAAEEVVAEACQRMLSSSETFMRYAAADTEGAKSLLSRLKNFIKKLRNAFRGSLNNEATRLIEDYEGLAAEWEKALNEAIANVSQIAAEGIIENNPSVAENIVGTELVTKESTKSSQRLNNELMDRAKKEFAKVGRDLGISYQDFYRAIALCNTIANRMLDPNDLAYYLPEDNPGKVEVGNASYGRSMENAMECIRSIVNNDFTDMVSEAVGRPLTVEEQLVASQILQIVNSRPECNYCYVATDRRAYRASFGTYFKQYDDVYNKVAENREAFSKDLNGAEKRMEAVKVDGGEKNLGKGVVAKAYAEFLNGRKNTPDMRKRFLGWVNSAVKGEMPISRRDLTSARVRDKAREDAAKKWFINDAEKYAQSATWAKKVSRVIKVGGKNYVAKYVSYNGSILKWNQTLIDKLNEEFGLRMYSFSDYVPAFILENMQMIIDASLRGLKVLAYTKDCGFAEAFAETGAGINISLFGTLDKKAYKDENLNALREAYKANKNDATRKAYLNALNQYVVRDGIGGKDGMMGANWDRASALRKTYKNVGTVFVATNDDLVEWALANPEIDVVIPYHLVRTGEEVAAFFDYKNFKAQQEDKKTKAWTSANLKSIPPTVHGNDLATYKQALKDNNLEPRFADFIDNPNYMKLVNETRLSYKEMSPVQPIFDQSIIEREVGRIKDEGQYGLMPGFKTKAEQDAFIENQNLVGQAVDAIGEWNESGKKPIDDTKYSSRDSQGRELSPDQQEYFADSKVRDENGNLKRMYHGTSEVGFTVFDTDVVDDGRSFFFTDDPIVAKTYSGSYSEYAPSRDNFDLETLNKGLEDAWTDRTLEKTDDGYALMFNGEEEARFDTLEDATQYIRDEFEDAIYEITGEETGGSGNYAVYLNITNPMIVDAKGSGWDKITPDEGAIEVMLEYKDGEWTLYKDDVPSDEEFDPWNYGNQVGDDELQEELDAFADSDSEGTNRFYTVLDGTGEYAIEWRTTRTIAEEAAEKGYDGVIIKNVLDTAIYGTASEQMRTSTVAIAFNSNQIKSINNTEPTSDDDIRYSLRSVPAVEPTTDEWQSGHSEAWFRENGFPIYEDVDAGQKGTKHKTANSSTVTTYRNIFEYLKRTYPDSWQNLRVLDASSGLGLGTAEGRKLGFNVSDIEPFHNADYKPMYEDYSALEDAVKSGEIEPFDFIISNAVLNVLPQDTRDNMVSALGNLLKPNGTLFVNTLGAKYQTKNGTITRKGQNGAGDEVFVPSTNTVQKGFSKAELKAYLRDALNGEYDFANVPGGIGITSLFATKNGVRYSIRDSVANYTDERIDRLLRQYGAKNTPNYAQAYAAYISPDDFLMLTTNDLGAIERESRELNEQELRDNPQEIFLKIEEKNGKMVVYGHEGRHRMVALRNQGVSEVAISVIDLATKYTKEITDSMTLSHQIFNEQNEEDFEADIERKAEITDLIPISYENEDILKRRFTGEHQVKFSYRDLANSESEILINALKNDAALVDELGAKQSIEAYAREYNRLKGMENQQIEITKQLRKKDTSPSEREVLLKKMVRLDRAILNKTTELTEMRNQRVIRDLLISEWDKRDTLVAAGRAEERYLTRKALEEKYGKELSSLKEKNRQKIKDIRERSEANKRKESIIKNTKKLMDMMLHPTDKKHIPSVLIEPLTEMLDGIDYWTPKEGRKVTQRQMRLRERFLNFKEAVERYMKLGEISDESKITAEMRADLDDYFGDTLDAEFLERIDELIEHTKNIDSVNDMSVEDLIDLDRTIREILKKINEKNQLISESKYQTIKELRDATVDHLNTLKTVSGSEKGNIRQRTNAGMADSYAFARYAGAGAEEVVDMLSKSFEHKIAQVKEAVEFTQGMLEPYKKQVSDWSKKKVDITLTAKQTEGKDKGKNVVVKMTVGQMMELYLLSKRKQARGHIFSEEGGSGIHLEDRNGKWTAEIPFTYADFETVMKHLRSVPGALKVADALQNYGATTITNWGNLASERMYGFEQFTDPDYWQIRTTGSNRGDTPNSEGAENAQLYKMKNYGRTKEVVANANSAINIGDAFDTWSKTIDEMTSYSSVLPAVTDALRWWNSRVSPTDGTRVKKLLADKLGKDMANVFKDTIIALNGGIMGSDSLDSIVRKLTGKAKAAAVAGNLRVVLQQPTAWTRALAEIEPQYLLKGLVMKPSVKEMQEHSAIAWHKAQGFYSNGLAPSLRKLIIGDASIGETLTEKSLWLAGKADDVTWGSLWNASKAKVEAENKALKKGSDAYWKEVNRVFSNIINNTQVVDTPLTKSTWMRGNGASMFFTAFMAEPTKTYSMVMTRLENAIRNPKDAKAWKAFCGVFAVFGLNAVVNAFAQAIADAARDDDKEKDYWEKYLEKFKGDIVDNVIPLNYIPVIKDAVSIAQGYRSNNNLATQSLNNVWNAYQDVRKAHDGKTTKTLFGTTESVAKAVSSVTGVPFGNVMRIFNSVGNVMGIDTFRRKKYTNSELGRNVVLSIEEGDTAAAEKYMKELLKNCKDDQDKANNYVITYLSEHSEEIDAWADKYMEDATKINEAIVSMRSKYSPEIIMKAIRKSINNEIEDDDDKLNLKTLADSQYTSDDINRMLEKGKIAKAYEIVDAVNEKYKKLESDSNAEDYVVDYLAKNDRDIQTWAKKYMDDPTTIDDAVEAMSKKYSRDVVMKAIRKSVNNGLKKDDKLITKTLADSHYTSDDINRMLEKGKISEAQEMIDEVNAYYKKMDSKSTAKNVVTAYWKEKYLAATGADRDRIARMLYRLKNNGKQMFSSKDLQKWVSDAKEKAEKAKK